MYRKKNLSFSGPLLSPGQLFPLSSSLSFLCKLWCFHTELPLVGEPGKQIYSLKKEVILTQSHNLTQRNTLKTIKFWHWFNWVNSFLRVRCSPNHGRGDYLSLAYFWGITILSKSLWGCQLLRALFTDLIALAL